MATSKNTDKDTATAAPAGERDRVAMVSLRADGTPDQHNPELVGDEASVADQKARLTSK